MLIHVDVIKLKHYPRYWPYVRGIHRSPVNSPHKGHWRGALMFLWFAPWINGWVNNREAGDLRRHRAHYDVIVICSINVVHCRHFFSFEQTYIPGSDMSGIAMQITLSGYSYIRRSLCVVSHRYPIALIPQQCSKGEGIVLIALNLNCGTKWRQISKGNHCAYKVLSFSCPLNTLVGISQFVDSMMEFHILVRRYFDIEIVK